MPGMVKNNPIANATTTNFMRGDPPHRPVLQWQVDGYSNLPFPGGFIRKSTSTSTSTSPSTTHSATKYCTNKSTFMRSSRPSGSNQTGARWTTDSRPIHRSKIMPGTVKNNPSANATTTNFMRGDPLYGPVLQGQVDDDSDSQFGGVCIRMPVK